MRRLPGTPCNICRLKRRGCNRAQPCGECVKRGLEDECSFRAEDMPPTSTHKRKASLPASLVEETSSQLSPVPLKNSSANPSKRPRISEQFHKKHYDVRKAETRLSLESPMAITSRTGTGNQSGDADVANLGPAQTEHSLPWSRNGQETLLELDPWASSSRTDSNEPETITRPNEESSGPPSYFTRLQIAVSRRTGFIKQEEILRDDQRPPQDPEPFPWNPPIPIRHADSRHPPFAPQRELTDCLVTTYLRREYVNLPILHLPDFKAGYGDARVGGSISTGSSPFHMVLNSLLSLACLSKGDKGDLAASAFYQRGQDLAHSSKGSPAVHVQSYILQAQYLIAIGDPKSAWTSIGAAIRSAQSHRMHLKTSGQDDICRSYKELCRKLWHSCLIMENMLALQIGVPPQTLQPFEVPLPSHLESDYLDKISGEKPSPGAERPSVIEFLAASARLYSHVKDIVAIEDEFRLCQGGCAAKKLLASDMTLLLKVDALLYDWKISLPSFLRADTPVQDPIALRQRNILRARYLYIRLRLYRPLFILALALSVECNCKPGRKPHMSEHDLGSPDSPVTLGLARDGSIKCVSAAVELVDILHDHEDGLPADSHGENTSPVPPAWESIDYLYACGLVLIAARICPYFAHGKDTEPITAAKLEDSWSRVHRLLEHYERLRRNSSFRNIAKPCLRTLEIFSNMIGTPGTAASTTADAAAGHDVLTKIAAFRRLGMTEQARERSRMTNGSSSASSPIDPPSARGQSTWAWIESLPIDLEG